MPNRFKEIRIAEGQKLTVSSQSEGSRGVRVNVQTDATDLSGAAEISREMRVVASQLRERGDEATADKLLRLAALTPVEALTAANAPELFNLLQSTGTLPSMTAENNLVAGHGRAVGAEVQKARQEKHEKARFRNRVKGAVGRFNLILDVDDEPWVTNWCERE